MSGNLAALCVTSALAALLFSGLVVGADASEPVSRLYDGLACYGFFLFAENKKVDIRDLHAVIHQGLPCLLSRVKREGIEGSQPEQIDENKLITHEKIKHGNRTYLHNGAFAAAVEMTKRKSECISALPKVLEDEGLEYCKFLVAATAALDMSWLMGEVLDRTSIAHRNTSAYLIIQKCFWDDMMPMGICARVKEMNYSLIHVEVATFCRSLRGTSRMNDINKMQRCFEIIDDDNLECFMNEDLIFVVKHLHLELQDVLREYTWSRNDVRFLMTNNHSDLLENVPTRTAKTHILDILKSDKDHINMVPTIYLLCQSIEAECAAEIESKMSLDARDFIALVKDRSLRWIEFRRFFEEHPAYAYSDLVFRWIAHRNVWDDILCTIIDKRVSDGRLSEEWLDETTSTFLLDSSRDKVLRKFRGTGVKLLLCRENAEVVQSLIRAGLVTESMLYVKKYDFEILKWLAAKDKWEVVKKLAVKMQDAQAFNEYALGLKFN